MAGHFKGYQVEHIDRRKNEAADALSRMGSQRKPEPPNTFLDILHNPSIKLPTEEDLAVPDPEAQLVAALHIIPDWTVPYLAYMNRGELPEDEVLARQIVQRSKFMVIHNGKLHHCGVSGVFQFVFLLKRAKRFCMRSTKEIVVTTPVQSPWLLKLFVMVFTGYGSC